MCVCVLSHCSKLLNTLLFTYASSERLINLAISQASEAVPVLFVVVVVVLLLISSLVIIGRGGGILGERGGSEG